MSNNVAHLWATENDGEVRRMEYELILLLDGGGAQSARARALEDGKQVGGCPSRLYSQELIACADQLQVASVIHIAIERSQFTEYNNAFR